ncbi:MAG: PHP domain-containing protein [Thomasclavelia spiroformis]
MEKYIDLHMHSKYSDDGEFKPIELVEKCHKRNIKIMAIADHNSVKAIAEAKKAANKLNITYIPAIEIDCTYNGIDLHVLGYGIDYHHEDFESLEKNILNQELKNSKEKIELTNNLGFDVDKEALKKLSSNGVYTGEMFGEVLLNDQRYLDHPLLKPYRKDGNRSDNPYVNFYWDYYAQGKPCYTKMIYPSLKETIELIKKHGGVAAFSNYHDKETVQYFYQAGLKYNMLITCGSDYHGKTKPAIELGECRCIIDEKEIEEQLKSYNLI